MQAIAYAMARAVCALVLVSICASAPASVPNTQAGKTSVGSVSKSATNDRFVVFGMPGVVVPLTIPTETPERAALRGVTQYDEDAGFEIEWEYPGSNLQAIDFFIEWAKVNAGRQGPWQSQEIFVGAPARLPLAEFGDYNLRIRACRGQNCITNITPRRESLRPSTVAFAPASSTTLTGVSRLDIEPYQGTKSISRELFVQRNNNGSWTTVGSSTWLSGSVATHRVAFPQPGQYRLRMRQCQQGVACGSFITRYANFNLEAPSSLTEVARSQTNPTYAVTWGYRDLPNDSPIRFFVYVDGNRMTSAQGLPPATRSTGGSFPAHPDQLAASCTNGICGTRQIEVRACAGNACQVSPSATVVFRDPRPEEPRLALVPSNSTDTGAFELQWPRSEGQIIITATHESSGWSQRFVLDKQQVGDLVVDVPDSGLGEYLFSGRVCNQGYCSADSSPIVGSYGIPSPGRLSQAFAGARRADRTYSTLKSTRGEIDLYWDNSGLNADWVRIVSKYPDGLVAAEQWIEPSTDRTTKISLLRPMDATPLNYEHQISFCFGEPETANAQCTESPSVITTQVMAQITECPVVGSNKKLPVQDSSRAAPIFGGPIAASEAPGRWWSPDRYGQGWDLFFNEPEVQQATVIWYSYEDEQPVWYYSQGNWVDEDFSGVLKTYRGHNFASVGDVRITKAQEEGKYFVTWSRDDNLQDRFCLEAFVNGGQREASAGLWMASNLTSVESTFATKDSDEPLAGVAISVVGTNAGPVAVDVPLLTDTSGNARWVQAISAPESDIGVTAHYVSGLGATQEYQGPSDPRELDCTTEMSHCPAMSYSRSQVANQRIEVEFDDNKNWPGASRFDSNNFYSKTYSLNRRVGPDPAFQPAILKACSTQGDTKSAEGFQSGANLPGIYWANAGQNYQGQGWQIFTRPSESGGGLRDLFLIWYTYEPTFAGYQLPVWYVAEASSATGVYEAPLKRRKTNGFDQIGTMTLTKRSGQDGWEFSASFNNANRSPISTRLTPPTFFGEASGPSSDRRGLWTKFVDTAIADLEEGDLYGLGVSVGENFAGEYPLFMDVNGQPRWALYTAPVADLVPDPNNPDRDWYEPPRYELRYFTYKPGDAKPTCLVAGEVTRGFIAGDTGRVTVLPNQAARNYLAFDGDNSGGAITQEFKYDERSFGTPPDGEPTDPTDPPPDPDPAGPLDSGPTIASTEAGWTNGAFRVDETGSAVYRVEIPLPRGSGGMTPELAVQVKTGSGDGLLGMGGNLIGLSSISRCGETLNVDDRQGPVTFTGSDVFCLDGQRLYETDSTAAYREFRTYIDTYQRVRGYGAGPEGVPAYFTVERADGSTWYYGSSDDANAVRNANAGSAVFTHSWLNNRIEDNIGNWVDYQYRKIEPSPELTSAKHLDQVVLDKVEYGGYERPAHTRVRFQYRNRQPQNWQTGFIAGYQGVANQLLERIELSSKGGENGLNTGFQHLRHYKFGYREQSQSVVLRDLTECSYMADPARPNETIEVCLQPTTFSWSGTRGPLDDQLRDFAAFGNDEIPVAPSAFPVDLNGDGITDMFQRGVGNSLVYLMEPESASGAVNKPNRSVAGTIRGEPIEVFRIDNGENEVSDTPVVAIDVDGDGRQSLLFLGEGLRAPRLCTWTSDSSAEQGQVDGQPIGEGFACGAVWIDVDGYPDTLKATDKVWLIDINGDGKTDLLTEDAVYLREDRRAASYQGPVDFGFYPRTLFKKYDVNALQLSRSTPLIRDRLADYEMLCAEEYGATGAVVDVRITSADSDRSLRKGGAAADINGNGLVDLLARVSFVCETPGDQFPSMGTHWMVLGATHQPFHLPEPSNRAEPFEPVANIAYVPMAEIGMLPSRFTEVTNGEPPVIDDIPVIYDQPMFMDLNSDGLADLLYAVKKDEGADWMLRLNTGAQDVGGRQQFTQAKAIDAINHVPDSPPDDCSILDDCLNVCKQFTALPSCGGSVSSAESSSVNALASDRHGVLFEATSDSDEGPGASLPSDLTPEVNSDFVMPMDVNGDGRISLVAPESIAPTTGGSAVWQWRQYRWNPETQSFGGDGYESTVLFTGFTGNSFKPERYKFGQFLGNGAVSILYAEDDDDDQTPHWRMFRQSTDANGVAIPNLVLSVREGSGRLHEIRYRPLSDASVYTYDETLPVTDAGGQAFQRVGKNFPLFRLKGGMQVVSHTIEAQPPGIKGSDTPMEVSYRYHNGLMQSGGVGVLGFETLSTTDLFTGVVTETTYHQAFPFSGRAIATVQCRNAPCTEDALRARSKSQYEFQTTRRFGSVKVPLVPWRIHETRTEQWIYSLHDGYLSNPSSQQPILIGKSIVEKPLSQFREGGHAATVVSTTFNGATLSGATDWTRVETINVYAPVDASGDNWILGRLEASQVTTTKSGIDAPLVKESSFGYYDDRHGTLNGMLRWEETASHLSNGSGAVIAGSGTTDAEDPQRHYLRTEYEYDQFGNRNQTRSCSLDMVENAGGCPAMVPLDNQALSFARATYKTFDPEGRYELSSTNAYGQTLEELLDWTPWGQPLRARVVSEFNIDGQNDVAMARYDAFGRKRFAYSVDGASAVTTRALVSAACSQRATGFCYDMVVTTQGVESAQTRVRQDWLGRERFQATLVDTNRWRVSESGYDARGRQVEVSEPYDATTATLWRATTGFWTRTRYDDLDRPTRVDRPDGGYLTKEYLRPSDVSLPAQYSDSRYSVIREIDPLGRAKTSVSNVLGERVLLREKTIAINGAPSVTQDIEYRFDIHGEMDRLTAPAQGGVTGITRDSMGRKIAMQDPNKGAWRYEYNALGELLLQVDANGNHTRFEYDLLGRQVLREVTNGGLLVERARWDYDTASTAPSFGQLEKSVMEGIGGSLEVERRYGYDRLGRQYQEVLDLGDTAELYSYTTYDQFGRVDQRLDATGDGRGEKYEYTDFGLLESVLEAAYGNQQGDALPLRSVVERDHRGNVVCEALANGLILKRTFAPSTGNIESIQVGKGSCTTGLTDIVQEETYDFNVGGHLTVRDRLFQFDGRWETIAETFVYDGFHRMQTHTVNGLPRRFEYDNLGRIQRMPGETEARRYGIRETQASCNRQPGPHAVTAANGATYCYDANGNQTKKREVSDNGVSVRTVDYTAFDKPSAIEQDGRSTAFVYDASRSHLMRIDDRLDGQGPVRTLRFGGIELEYPHLHQGGEVDVTIRRLMAGHINEEMTGRFNVSSGVFNNLLITEQRFSLTDYQGSVVGYTDIDGELLEQMRYEPFGRSVALPLSYQSDAMAIGLSLSLAVAQEKRFGSAGYTGHDAIANFGLIHMGGRLYDASLGRFLSADPFVQAPENSQNLDRYAYVLNNPVSYTDPSGYFFSAIADMFDWVKDNWRAVASIAITIWLPGAGFMTSAFGGAVGANIAAGAIAGFVGSGGLEGAVLGAFSAFGHGIVGDIFELSSASMKLGNVVGNGVVGGLAARGGGGNFGHGFTAAAASAGAKIVFKIPKMDHRADRIAAAAIVGGSVSQITGGKFANGAVTAAFVQAFNSETARKRLERRFLISDDELTGLVTPHLALHRLEKLQDEFRRLADELDAMTTLEYAEHINYSPGSSADLNLLSTNQGLTVSRLRYAANLKDSWFVSDKLDKFVEFLLEAGGKRAVARSSRNPNSLSYDLLDAGLEVLKPSGFVTSSKMYSREPSVFCRGAAIGADCSVTWQ
jgi:RHS repeat-associated protein